MKAPIRVDLEVTGKCNLRCSHCYNFWRPENSIPPLTISNLNHILHQIKKNEIMEITLTGGEPFLEDELVFRILEFCKKSAIAVSINSNLTVVNDSIATQLSVYKPSIMTSLFSFDSITHENITGVQNSFNKTIEGIKILLGKGIPVSVNMVVTPYNFSHIYETGSFVHDIGVKTFTVVRSSPPIYCINKKEFTISRKMVIKTLDELLRLNQDFKLNVGNQNCYPLCMLDDWSKYEPLNLRNCGAGVFHCAIGADGNIRACVQGNLTYGNLLYENLSDIWIKMQPWREGKYMPKQCKHCEFLRQCTAGCRSDSYVHTGKINSLDFYAKKGVLGPSKGPVVNSPNKWLDLNDTLFLPRLKFRVEEFGILIALLHRQTRHFMVTKDSADLLYDLQEQTFKLIEIIKKYNLDEASAIRFFTYLAIRRIVRKY